MHQCKLCWNDPSIGNLLSFDGLIQHSFHTSVFIYLMHPIVFSIQMLQYFRHFGKGLVFFAFDTNCYFISVILFPAWLMFENSTETGLKRSRDTTAYLPPVPYFPGLYRKYKHVPVSRMCTFVQKFRILTDRVTV